MFNILFPELFSERIDSKYRYQCKDLFVPVEVDAITSTPEVIFFSFEEDDGSQCGVVTLCPLCYIDIMHSYHPQESIERNELDHYVICFMLESLRSRVVEHGNIICTLYIRTKCLLTSCQTILCEAFLFN